MKTAHTDTILQRCLLDMDTTHATNTDRNSLILASHSHHPSRSGEEICGGGGFVVVWSSHRVDAAAAIAAAASPSPALAALYSLLLVGLG